MSRATKRRVADDVEPVRVLGRGLRAHRGVHLTIRTLREALGKTQTEVAEAARIDQADISRLEARESFSDCQVSTLERYIAALGGHLDIVAVFGNKSIILVEVKTTPSADGPPDTASTSHRKARRG